VRIAHFVQRYPPALGGSEAYFARLSRFLAVEDQVTVFTTVARDLEAFWSRRGRTLPGGISIEDAVEVRRYPLLRWPGRRYLLKALSFFPHHTWRCMTLPCNPIAWQMWRDATHGPERFDLVHATALPYGWPMVCGLQLARRLRVPFLLTPFLHLGNPNDPRDRTRRTYLSPALLSLVQAADCVFVQTNLERSALLRHGVASEKLVLLGMGVAAEECSGGNRQAARTAWACAKDEIVIGHLANNSEEKGTVDLLRAAAKAWDGGRRFRLVLAGPEMPNFRDFWKSFRPAGRVQRLGVLDEREKRDFFAGIDVFALPSRSDSFGLVLLEAWANGVPNLAYRAGGVAEVIHHEHDGLLVDCGNTDGLAAALGRIVEDEPLRRRLGEAGRARTKNEFRWSDKLQRVREVYREMCERGSAVQSLCS
jgi:glycosyltransferase involved in cell wall biosynthesis